MKTTSIIFFTVSLVTIGALSIRNIIPQENNGNVNASTTTTELVTEKKPLPKEDHRVKLVIYGKNDHGQLATTLNLPGVLRAIAAGKSHSLALTNNGYVYSWGLNNVGQLGRETLSDNNNTPMIIESLSDIRAISTSHNHSLALSNSGTVYAWGQNYTGQLGDGTNIDRADPIEITGLPKIVEVTAGHKFSLALAENSDVYAWGGLCSNTNSEKATALLAKVGGQLTSLQGGYYDSSATGEDSYDITQDCLNEDAVNIKSTTPIRLPITNVTMISAGYGHALLLQKDGSVIGMGCNTFGQAGRTPGAQKGELVKIEGLPKIVQIAAGGRHSVFLDVEGNVYTVGSNSVGQIGNRRRLDVSTPFLVSEMGTAQKIFAGYDYTIAIAKNGSMWEWGNNQSEFFHKFMPLRMDLPMQFLEKSPTLTATGGAHAFFSSF